MGVFRLRLTDILYRQILDNARCRIIPAENPNEIETGNLKSQTYLDFDPKPNWQNPNMTGSAKREENPCFVLFKTRMHI